MKAENLETGNYTVRVRRHCTVMSMYSFSSLHLKPKKPRRMRGGGELILHATFCIQDYHI